MARTKQTLKSGKETELAQDIRSVMSSRPLTAGKSLPSKKKSKKKTGSMRGANGCPPTMYLVKSYCKR